MAEIQDEMEEFPFESREYVHQTCGGVTTVAGGSLRSLACPFEYVSGTYCAACGRVDLVFCFEWEDTGERVSEYRSRVFWKSPLRVKLVVFGLIPLLCGIGVLLSLPFLPKPGPNGGDPKVIAMLAVPFGMLVGNMVMVLTPLSYWAARLCGTNFKQYR